MFKFTGYILCTATMVLFGSGTVYALLEKPALVSTEWLAGHLDHPDLRVIDARPSLRPYIEAHLPGAVYLNTESIRISEGGVPASLLPSGQIAAIFQRIGIGRDHTVIIYSSGEDSFAHATYVAFLLEWLGHDAVGVLDGGMEKWVAEGRPVTAEFPRLPRVPDQDGVTIRPDIMATAPSVLESVSTGQALLLDARGPAVFQAGHLPGARIFPLQNTLREGEFLTWKTPDELREMAAEAGARKGKTIITYCTSGRESSQIWFSLRHVAGLDNVLSFHGSWIDWTTRGLPVEKP